MQAVVVASNIQLVKPILNKYKNIILCYNTLNAERILFRTLTLLIRESYLDEI